MNGNALTAAYVFRPVDNQRLTLEVLAIRGTRRERTFRFGQPSTANETQASQHSLRLLGPMNTAR